MNPGVLGQKHVVVTGGAGALGGAVVDRLRAAGATVHVPCFEAEVPAALRAIDGVVAVAGIDLTDEAAVAAYYAALPPLWASVQVAGGFDMGPLVDTSLAVLQKLIGLNLVTCFNACRHATSSIRRGGAGGRLVNIAAKPALDPVAGVNMSAYAATKAAVAGFTRALAEELAPEGIWVNAIAPSIIDSPANRSAMPDADHSRWPTPTQLAEVIFSLVSPDNAVVRGAVLPVYGRS